MSLATRIFSILSDGLVVVLTWAKTFRVYKLARATRFRTNYAALLLRDDQYRLFVIIPSCGLTRRWIAGTLYFLCVILNRVCLLMTDVARRAVCVLNLIAIVYLMQLVSVVSCARGRNCISRLSLRSEYQPLERHHRRVR